MRPTGACVTILNAHFDENLQFRDGTRFIRIGFPAEFLTAQH